MELTGAYTKKGLALLAKVLSGGTLAYTRAEAGSGTTAETAAALDRPRQTLTLLAPRREGDTATLPVTLAAYQAKAAYALTEIGVYARDPEEGEILFKIYRLDGPVEVSPASRTVLRFYLSETVAGDAAATAPVSPAGVLLAADFEPVRAAVQATYTPAQYVTVAASELQGYLDALPRLLTKDLTITVSGTWEGTLHVRGFYGPGMLTITGAALGDWTIRGRVVFAYCTLYMTVQNLLVQATEEIVSPNDILVRGIAASSLVLLDVRITGNGTGLGHRIEASSQSTLGNCVVSNCHTAVMAATSSLCSVYCGDQQIGKLWQDNTIGAYPYRGGVILLGEGVSDTLGGSVNVKGGGIITKHDGILL